jgi:hypothetical protein
MQRIKPSVVLAAAAVVGIALYASAYVEQTGSRMAVAAKRFLDSLPQGKAEKATFRFGANPGEIRQGPRQGLRTLADREDTAMRLVQDLDGNQKKTAIVSPKAPHETRAAGTSLQLTAIDIDIDGDGDGDLDLVGPGKSGLYLFENLGNEK